MMRWRIAAPEYNAGPGKMGSTVPISPIAISTSVTLHQKSSIARNLAGVADCGDGITNRG